MAGVAGGYAYWVQEQAVRVPLGLARANRRIEVERVNIATKYAGRIAELRVDEGAFKRAMFSPASTRQKSQGCSTLCT